MLPAEGVGKGCHGGESNRVGCPVEEESSWPIQLKATDHQVWIGLRARYPQNLARDPSFDGTGPCIHWTGTKSAIGVAHGNGTGGSGLESVHSDWPIPELLPGRIPLRGLEAGWCTW